MFATAVAVLFVSQPVGGKLHESVLRSGIVGMWRLHQFDRFFADPRYATVCWYRMNGRYFWSHQLPPRPPVVGAGRYEITGDRYKEFANPGMEIPPGNRVARLLDRKTLQIDFSNGQVSARNIYYRIESQPQVAFKEYSNDEFAEAVRPHLGSRQPRR